ncbi:MAG TPA: hypothetical protein VMB34_16410 [Acetobacteraceae bacterium]|nr:hypothetical protein [Acetobacteraceae bacterium]
MQVVRVCLAVVCLLLCGFPAVGAETKPPPGRVVRLPPEQAIPVLGVAVTGPDGKTIGRLVDILVDAAGAPQAGVIDVGGFMGVGARKIAVHWSTLHFAPDNPKQPITLALTLDQIKAAPEFGSPGKPAPVVVPARPRSAPAGVTQASATPGAPEKAGAGSNAPSATATPAGPATGGAQSGTAAPAGTPPSGNNSVAAVPSGNGPAGTVPSGSGPAGTVPSGNVPAGTVPSGNVPASAVPSGHGPAGAVPSGSGPTGTSNGSTSAAGSGAAPAVPPASGSAPGAAPPSPSGGPLSGQASATGGKPPDSK